MKLLACGINHETADLALREQVSFSNDYLAASLGEMLRDTRTEEAVLLSTCNRTEFYCINGDAENTMQWLYRYKQLPQGCLQAHWYVHQQEHALRHILRVASGLDSKILGEPQILGQLKTAFSVASALGFAGSQLTRLSQYIWSVTKQVRCHSAITAHPVSLAFAVVTSAKHIFANLANTRVLLVGAGDIIALVAKHCVAQGIRHFWIANRSLAHAETLALQVGGQAVCLNAIPYFLAKADMVIAATGCALPLISKEMLEVALKQRKRRPLFMADLAVPRDIEPTVNDLKDVYLYSLDDLQNLIQKNQRYRKAAAHKAESLIESKVKEYLEKLKIKTAVPFICCYRQQAERLRDTEVNKALVLLEKGYPPHEVVKRLAYCLTNKLIHQPSVAFSKAAQLNQETLLVDLFNLHAEE